MNTRRSTSEDDALALRLVACFNDEQVLQKMLENKIDNLTKEIDSLTKLDESKNLRLNDLEKRILTLEANADRQEPGDQTSEFKGSKKSGKAKTLI